MEPGVGTRHLVNVARPPRRPGRHANQDPDQAPGREPDQAHDQVHDRHGDEHAGQPARQRSEDQAAEDETEDQAREGPEDRPSEPPDDRAAEITRLTLLSEAGIRLPGALEPRQVGRELTSLALEWFAEAVGVYMLEHLVAEDMAPRTFDGSSIEVRRLAVGGAAGLDIEAMFPAGEVRVFTPRTPYARCVATGLPQQFTMLNRGETEHIDRTAAGLVRDRLLDLSDFVAVPLMARDQVLGFALFARGPESAPFSAADVRLAVELSARAGVCLESARLYGRERAAARALQASLLPGPADVVPGLEMAHRHRPAGHNALVGGDWYDVIPLDDKRVALIIGDTMGHGTAAAATMVQLRAAVRTLASLDLTPSEVLRRLDRLTPSLGPAQFATCVYAVFDTAEQVCTYSRAGHPPPLLALPDGRCEALEVPRGLPLGLGEGKYGEARLGIPAGATLILYTDGLVESRRRDLDAGVSALKAALFESRGDVHTVCETLFDRLVVQPNEDDVTLMLVRTDPVPGGS